VSSSVPGPRAPPGAGPAPISPRRTVACFRPCVGCGDTVAPYALLWTGREVAVTGFETLTPREAAADEADRSHRAIGLSRHLP
jgi:hypothetical protein